MNEQNQQPTEQMTRHERREVRKEEAERRLKSELRAGHAKRWGIGLAALVAIAAGIWGLTKIPGAWSPGDVLSACVNHGGVSAMHWHPTLRIVINGEPQDIPEGIGISGGCMRPIHTHDETGKLHIESPVIRDFTLGQFFTLWEKPFSRDEILDARVDETHELVMTVNGQRVDTYENTVLRDDDQIVIEYRAK